MKVTLCYALPQRQYLEEMDVAEGCTVEEAIALSHIHEAFPELEISALGKGIFGKLVKGTQPLQEGDRIELYRPLPRKPRDARAVADKKARIRQKKEAKAQD